MMGNQILPQIQCLYRNVARLSMLVIALLPFESAYSQDFDNGSSQKQFGQCDGYSVASVSAESEGLGVLWSKPVGQGRSQIVGDQGVVFVASGEKAEEDKSSITRVQALELATGKKLWEWQARATLRGKQQTFGGAFPSPQATPLLTASRLIVLSFTGELACLDRKTGELMWQADLVDRFTAFPVQFGFSSSPVADPSDTNAMLILAAGEQGGLLKVRISDGKLIWKISCKSPSYATPVMANFGGQKQWVIVSEDGVHGIDAAMGAELWNYSFAEAGLTNVPTPLVVDDKRLIVSGQGAKGTRCIEVTKKQDQWSAREQWANQRVQFFYTNWLIDNNGLLWGCTSDYLAVMSLDDGKTVGRVRGFSDGNILKTSKGMLVLGGKGRVSSFRNAAQKEQPALELIRQVQTPAGRCWTAPSVIGNCLFVRSGEKLHCLSWAAEGAELLADRLKQPKSFKLSLKGKEPDPVERIFGVFQKDGQIAALDLYARLRTEGKLSLQARIDLVLAAQQQGLQNVAKGILEHAIQDFPNSEELQNLKKPTR